MMKKLLAKKQNNKGFSLVELIVVVLIIAIIAVALAPQVMKWVGTARTNVDDNNEANIKSAVSVAVADYSKDKTIGASHVLTVGTSDITEATATTEGTALINLIKEVMNGDYPQPQSGGNFVITISAEGAVSITKTP